MPPCQLFETWPVHSGRSRLSAASSARQLWVTEIRAHAAPIGGRRTSGDAILAAAKPPRFEAGYSVGFATAGSRT